MSSAGLSVLRRIQTFPSPNARDFGPHGVARPQPHCPRCRYKERLTKPLHTGGKTPTSSRAYGKLRSWVKVLRRSARLRRQKEGKKKPNTRPERGSHISWGRRRRCASHAASP